MLTVRSEIGPYHRPSQLYLALAKIIPDATPMQSPFPSTDGAGQVRCFSGTEFQVAVFQTLVPFYPDIPKDCELLNRYKNTIVVCSLFAKSVHLRLNRFQDHFKGFLR